MTSIRRLSRLALPVLVGIATFVLPGRAQAPLSPRFAFADTTLLRDTLDLKFDRLFETADSLRVLPDSLRAQMIRFRLPMYRLVAMADSMGVPVDSVGAIILRESFNPLSMVVGAASRTTFKYTSGYQVGRTSSVWSNGADYTLVRGALFLRNGTNISMDRSTAGNRLSLRQERTSTSEANWRLNPGWSVGGRLAMSGFDNRSPGAVGDEGETKNDIQLSTRTRRPLIKTSETDLNSELNLFAGFLDLKNFSQIKRGLSNDMNGRLRLTRGSWLSHDLNAGLNGNLSRTRAPSAVASLRTSDFSANVRGALQVYQQAPVGMNVNYAVRRTRVETPTDADTINRINTSSATVDATVRLRLDNDRYLNITANAGNNRSLNGTRFDNGLKAQLRWVQAPWALDADYSDLLGDSRFPLRAARAGGYNEKADNRTASATLTRPIGRRLTAKLTSNISLQQFRSVATATESSPPTPRDIYRQSYKAETLYNPSERLNTAVALDVGLSRSINLPAASTGNNSDTRSYRAEWRWSYRMLRGLTASQSNTVQANYEFFPFAEKRNGLGLDFNSVTTLAAVLTPRLTMDVIHNARQQPRGDWQVQPDGTGVLLPSDEQLDYTLRSRVTWSPSRAVSLTLTPEYLANNRNGTSNGVEAPTRRSRRLNFAGGANLNLPVGRKGLLTGTISRTFSADRSTSYKSGLPQPSSLVEQDYWNGSLQFSWEL
ncbi:MAG: hypothetical protein ABL977_15130 [Candidatus Eisenbacteria bacterium]